MQDKGDVEFVDEHLGRTEASPISSVEIGREVGPEGACGVALMTAPHQMVPDRQMVVGQVAPGAVELGVPIVEIAHIGGLETGPVELEGHHQRLGV